MSVVEHFSGTFRQTENIPLEQPVPVWQNPANQK
jgi:hypothetical protein